MVCMALTLALGAAVWWFSAITLQAEMGRLLALLLLVHGLLALTALPALAAVLCGARLRSASPALRGAGSAHRRRDAERRTER